MIPKLIDITDEDLKKPKVPLTPVTDDDFKKKVPPVKAGASGTIAAYVGNGSLNLPEDFTSSSESVITGDPMIFDDAPSFTGRYVTGVNKPPKDTESVEDKEARQARYDSIYNSSAEEIFTNYQTKVRGILSNIDTKMPMSGVRNAIDVSLLEQSREGKVANTIVNFAKGNAALDDLKYLRTVAPKALSSLAFGTTDGPVNKLTDEALIPWLDTHNKSVAEKQKIENIEYFAQESTEINKKLSAIGIDTLKLNNSDYVSTVAEQYKKNKQQELAEVDKLYPTVIRMLQGDNLDQKLIADNAEVFGKWSASKDVVEKKYSELNHFLGKAYGNAYAKANPGKSPKEIGEKILQYSNPDLYQLGQKNDSDYGDQTKDIAMAGIQAMYSTGDEGTVKAAMADERDIDKLYPQQLIKETYHRLGAELYKEQNWFFNANPSIETKDKAAANLPDANKEAYYKYIRPVESRILGTDIPMSGFVNKLGEGFASTTSGTLKSGADLLSNIPGINLRTDKDRAGEILNPETKFQDVGTYNLAKQKLGQYNVKLKSGEQLSVEEFNDKRDLETYTGVRSTLQEVIDGSGNLTGQVLFQALGTKAAASLLSSAAKGLGLLDEAIVAADVEESIAADAIGFGIKKQALIEAAAIGTAYMSTFDDGKKQALELFPDDADSGKRALYAQIYAGTTALSSRIFKDEKILDAFGKNVSPKLATLVGNITEGKVKREMLGPAISDIVKTGVQFTGELLKQDFKEATEEALESIGQTTAIAIMAPAKYNYNNAYNEAVETFATTFINGGVVAGFASAGNLKSNRVSMPLLSRMGVDKQFTAAVRNEIGRQEQYGIITPDEAFVKKYIVEQAEVINQKNIPQIMQTHNLNEYQKVKYFGHLLHESTLKRSIDNTTDNPLKKVLTARLEESEKIRSGILEGSLFVTDNYGVQTEDEANVQAKSEQVVEEVKEEVVVNKALVEAVELLNKKEGLLPHHAPSEDVSPETVIQTIVDQVVSGNRQKLEGIYSPEIVAKALEAFPPPVIEITEQPKVEMIAKDTVYTPKENGDFIDAGVVTVIEQKDGNVTVKFDDDTFSQFTQKDFEENFELPVAPAEPVENIELTNTLKEEAKKNIEVISPIDASIDAADLFQNLKIGDKNTLYSNPILGIPAAIWNASMDIISASIKAGREIKVAIQQGIKYITDNHKGTVDESAIMQVLGNHLKAFNEKPVRKDAEPKADYAVRVLEWRRRMLATGTTSQQVDALKNSNAEMEFIKKVNEGAELLGKSLNITHEEFNKQLGLPVADFDTYVASLKYIKSSNKEAGKLLNSIRSADPKKVAASEVSLIKKQLHDFQTGFRAGSKEAKEQMKIIKDGVQAMLHDYNELGLLDGVNYTAKEMLTLGARINNVVSETSFDHLNAFMQGLIDKAEYGRFLLKANDLAKQIKKVVKSKTVTQNDIPVLKELATLNPVMLQNIGTYMGMLEDVTATRTVKEVERKYTNEEIKEFTEAAKQNEVDIKATSITERFDYIINSQAFKDAVAAGAISPSVEGWARRQVNEILVDTTTSLEEKKAALNEVNSVVGMFARSVFMKEAVAPEAIANRISDDADAEVADGDGNLRTQLEELAKAQQETIGLLDEDVLTDEQKVSLGILAGVDVTGRDSKTLKLFSNVLNNVITNGDSSGVGVFEVIKRGQDNARPLLKYLADTGKKILDRSLKSKLGKLRFVTLSKSAILTTLTNNNAEVSTKLDNAVSWNDMTSGFAVSGHEYHHNIVVKLRDIFTKYPDLHNDPDSVVRLSLYSFLNQSISNSTVLEQNAQLQRRIGIIRADIKLKTEQGIEADRNEGAREQKVLDGFRNVILEKTGKDIYEQEQLKTLTKEDFDKPNTEDAARMPFLSEGEDAVYKLFRDYQKELQPKHIETVNYYLNEKYEPWDNYMRDSYRQLGSGLVNVELADEGKLGFTSANKNMDAASGSTIERTKGNPLAKKSGEPQRVLNLHFYNVQEEGVKGVLEDIHTLAYRMSADEGFLNPELKTAIGNDNHELLKKSVTNYVKNEMGVGRATDKELRMIKKGLDVISTIGVRRQLLSLSAFVKQYTDTLIKTPFNLGKDWQMFFQAGRLTDNEGAQALLKQNGISHRKENLAGLNIISDEKLSDKDNTIGSPEEQSVIKSAYDSMSNLLNRFANHINKGGVEKEAFIAKPIKYGDYIPAAQAWLSYYGQWLVSHGKVDKFENIDWDKENSGQDREASAYAEQMTSKKLNENTKAARSMLINDPSVALHVFKNIFFPFGSFNMHNWNIMVEDMRTLTSKQMIVDENYRNDEGATAAKSLMSSIVGEVVFQGIKQGIRIFIAKNLLTGLIALYSAMFGGDDEDDQVLALLKTAAEKSGEKEVDTAFEKWYSETIGNLFFGGFGNQPQKAAEKMINYLTDSKFFYEPSLTVNQELENQFLPGMIGSAFSGLGSLSNDAYRAIFEPDNRYGEEVNVTSAEKGIIAITMLSELATMAGYGDADINRAIEKVRSYVDRGMKDKYKDPNFEDMEEFFNRPKKVSVSGTEYKLTKEMQDYMIDQRAERLNQLKSATISEKDKRKFANDWAKAALLQKYGPDVLKDPIKKK